MATRGSLHLTQTLALLLVAAAPAITQAQTTEIKAAQKDPATCQTQQITAIPGSHYFASDFIEAIATDPRHPHGPLYALTADLSSPVPYADRAIYLSRSTTSGATWTPIARIDSRYFIAEISEGLRNGLAVSPNAADFVVTTQQGAFQVIPQSTPADAIIRRIPGPRVPRIRPDVTIAKKTGDPVRAGVIQMSPDGQHLIIGFGYFDDQPQLIAYHRSPRNNNPWIEDGPLPPLPTDLDIFSMLLDTNEPSSRAKSPHADAAEEPASLPMSGGLYVGTGDQAYHLNFRTKKWTQVTGVGPDSAIHCMSTVHGLHIAACWGVYEPVNALAVQRVTTANFLLHRAKDETGPNIRAYGIEVDPARPSQQVLSAITGVYITKDSGKTWKRLNDLPEGEFRTAHINPDGTVIVSGYIGTYRTNPFSNTCEPHLKTRDQ
jgi:hypothetical protein